MRNFAHLKQHPLNNQLVGTPGAGIFTHLRVEGFGTERSIGIPNFKVWENVHTWNIIRLIASELLFQMWICSHTWVLWIYYGMVCGASGPHYIKVNLKRRDMSLTNTVTSVSLFLPAVVRTLVRYGRRYSTGYNYQLWKLVNSPFLFVYQLLILSLGRCSILAVSFKLDGAFAITGVRFTNNTLSYVVLPSPLLITSLHTRRMVEPKYCSSGSVWPPGLTPTTKMVFWGVFDLDNSRE